MQPGATRGPPAPAGRVPPRHRAQEVRLCAAAWEGARRPEGRGTCRSRARRRGASERGRAGGASRPARPKGSQRVLITRRGQHKGLEVTPSTPSGITRRRGRRRRRLWSQNEAGAGRLGTRPRPRPLTPPAPPLPAPSSPGPVRR